MKKGEISARLRKWTKDLYKSLDLYNVKVKISEDKG